MATDPLWTFSSAMTIDAGVARLMSLLDNWRLVAHFGNLDGNFAEDEE